MTTTVKATPFTADEEASHRTGYHDGSHGDACVTCRTWATVDVERASKLTWRWATLSARRVIKLLLERGDYVTALAWLEEVQDLTGENTEGQS